MQNLTIIKKLTLILILMIGTTFGSSVLADTLPDLDGDGSTVEDCNDTDVSISPDGVEGLLTAPYAASYVISSSQGLTKAGNAVESGRSNTETALTQNARDITGAFYSLGFAGEIIIGFSCPVTNGDGNDLRVYEKTYGVGSSYPEEKIQVYAWDMGASDWVLLGTGNSLPNSQRPNVASNFDLGSLTSTTKIKIVDITDPSLHSSAADAYDLNGVYALQNCNTTCDGIDNDCDGIIDNGSYSANICSGTASMDLLSDGSAAIATWDEHTAWTATIPGATWIWHEYLVSNPTDEHTESFFKGLSLPSNATNIALNIEMAADNAYSVLINGTTVALDTGEFNYRLPTDSWDFSSDIIAGDNEFEFQVTNWEQSGGTAYSNPAGLTYCMQVSYDYTCEEVIDECDSDNILFNGGFEATDDRKGLVHSIALNALGTAGSWDIYDSLPRTDSDSSSSWYTDNSTAGIELQYTGTVVPAYEGNFYAELDSHANEENGTVSNSSMSQEITLAGGNYQLSFYYRPRTSTTDDNPIQVYFDEVLIETVDGIAPTNWTLYTIELTDVAPGEHKVTFTADGIENTLGGFLDQINLACGAADECTGDDCSTDECTGDDCGTDECTGDDCGTDECTGDDCGADDGNDNIDPQPAADTGSEPEPVADPGSDEESIADFQATPLWPGAGIVFKGSGCSLSPNTQNSGSNYAFMAFAGLFILCLMRSLIKQRAT